ncbi:MAG: hypothetical protein ACOC55_01285 [Candidatus Natronoplasma sp.]
MRGRYRFKRELPSDGSALEGLPLQLMIIVLVLAIGVPAVYTSMRYYDTQNVIQKVENQVEFIEQKAKMLYTYGAGNSDVIKVDLEPGVFREVEYMELCNETFRDMIRWKIDDGQTGMHFLGDNISLVSGSDEPLRLGSGTHQLRLETRRGDPFGTGEDTLYVEISSA